jgi:hypothetical protein
MFSRRKESRLKKKRRRNLGRLNYGQELSEKKKRLPLRNMLRSTVTKKWNRYKQQSMKEKKKKELREKHFHRLSWYSNFT